MRVSTKALTLFWTAEGGVRGCGGVDGGPRTPLESVGSW